MVKAVTGLKSGHEGRVVGGQLACLDLKSTVYTSRHSRRGLKVLTSHLVWKIGDTWMLDEIHGARGINSRVGSVPGNGRQYCDIFVVMSRRKDGGMVGVD